MTELTYQGIIRNHLSRMKEIRNPKYFKAMLLHLEDLLAPLITEKKEV